MGWPSRYPSYTCALFISEVDSSQCYSSRLTCAFSGRGTRINISDDGYSRGTFIIRTLLAAGARLRPTSIWSVLKAVL